MDVSVDRMAWVDRGRLTDEQLKRLRKDLTIRPKKVGDHPGDPPEPIHLLSEANGRVGMPRAFYLDRTRDHHNITYDGMVSGRTGVWSDDTPQWNPERELRASQQRGVSTVVNAFRSFSSYGGVLKAVPGWGKTVVGCAIANQLRVPTLVVVHKEFLIKQWRERIDEFLPGARVGHVQGDTLDYEDKHIVIGMVHTLSGREYDEAFYRQFGLLMVDEVHRIGAPTWAPVPGKFPAQWRLGLSGTPKRKDGAANVFFYHIGPLLFTSKEERLKPTIKRVWTKFKIPQSPSFNPSLIRKTMVLKFLCANQDRNRLIVNTLINAVKAGRKILVLSERKDKHLQRLHALFHQTWKDGPTPSTGFYTGGMKEEDLEKSEQAQILFATVQYVKEGLDIPSLDTLFLATPMSVDEQAIGRILRPYEGKKDPMVVDFRDDNVALCRRLGEYRWRFYEQMGWV
jgi:superfamily II DNA or RNA helicase